MVALPPIAFRSLEYFSERPSLFLLIFTGLQNLFLPFDLSKGSGQSSEGFGLVHNWANYGT